MIARADMVSVITSSAGYEAAVLGKQVLHFGRHGHALDLPHVHQMNGFADMRQVPTLLADDSAEAIERRKRDGARYFLSLKEFGLDMSSFGRARATGTAQQQGVGADRGEPVENLAARGAGTQCLTTLQLISIRLRFQVEKSSLRADSVGSDFHRPRSRTVRG